MREREDGDRGGDRRADDGRVGGGPNGGGDADGPDEDADAPAAGHRVLVPVEILRGETVPEALIRLFASVPVVLLGYHEIPDQTAPGQARMQFEEKAADELDDLVEAFEEAGGDVTTRLVFTRDPMKSFERVAVELDCDSVLLLNPAPALDRVLVPLRGDVNVVHVARLVGAVLAGTDVEATLFHVASDGAAREAGEAVLESAAQTLAERGVDPSRIARRVVVDDAPRDAIVDAADDHDLVVLGEHRPSIRDFVFGDTSRVVANRTVGPVLVVRRPYIERESE